MTTTTAQLVSNLRDALADLRRFESPAAEAQRAGRNSGATSSAIERKWQRIRTAEEALRAAGERDLIGTATAEDKLARRIAEARTLGQERPELKARLAAARRALRAA